MIRERLQPMGTHGRASSTERNSSVAKELVAVLGHIRTDAYSLFAKTQSVHWHLSGPDFKDHHLLLDNQTEQLASLIEAITERMQTLGGSAVRAVDCGDRIHYPNAGSTDFLDPEDVFAELRVDNQILTGSLRSLQPLCLGCGDVVTGSLVDVWIDDTRRRAWTLFEIIRRD